MNDLNQAAVDALNADDNKQDIWDGSSFKLKYKDEEIIPESREKLIELAQRGVLYDHKSADLAKEREAINSLKSKYDIYDQLNAQLEAHPEIIERLNSIMSGNNDNNDNSNVDPKVQELEHKLNDLSQFKSSIEQERASKVLEQDINTIKSSYKQFDWDKTDEDGKTLVHKVLQHALDNSISNLNTAARDYLWDINQKEVEANTLKKAKEELKNKKHILNGDDKYVPNSSLISKGDTLNSIAQKLIDSKDFKFD